MAHDDSGGAKHAERPQPHGTGDRLGEPKYLLLTTYRRDGTPVPTPVWCVRVDGRLRIITDAASGKVKRIRHDSSVLVGPCDARGRHRGPQLPAVAALLPESEVDRTTVAIRDRYGILGRILLWRQERRARRSMSSSVAIEIVVMNEPDQAGD